MITRTVSKRTFTYSHNIGRGADGGTGFRLPVDVAPAGNGVIYVLNRMPQYKPGATRISKMLLGGKAGEEEFILEFGGYGTNEGQFIQVTSLALDSQENVYVADEWLNKITIFDKNGNLLSVWGTPGSEAGELMRPWGLAFDADECLWTVESGNHRVQKFTKEGKFLAGWGRKGTGEGEFDMPWGITIDDAGDVYVADWQNSRVQKLTKDGRFLMTFGAPGSGEGELVRPSGVAVDDEGDVYVSDFGADRVHAYASDGSYLTTFVGDAQELPTWGQMSIAANPDLQRARKRAKSMEPEWRFCWPTAVKVNDTRQIIIADQQRHRLQVYVKEKDYVEPQFNL